MIVKNKLYRIYIYSALCLLFYFSLYFLSQYSISPDSPSYLENAAIIKGLKFSQINYTRPLLYSFFIAIVNIVIPSFEISASVVSLISTVLMMVPLFLLARDIFDSKTAYLSVLLTVLYPWISRYSFQVLPDISYVAIVVFAAYFLRMAINRGDRVYYFLSGLFIGLAYLTRNEGIAFAAVVLLLILLNSFYAEDSRLAACLKGSGFYLLGLSIMVIPYIYYLYSKTGEWVFTARMGTVSFGIENDFTAFSVRRTQVEGIYQYICGNLPMLFTKYFHNLKLSFCEALPDVVYPFLFPFIIVGLFAKMAKNKVVNGKIFLLSLAMTPFLIIPFGRVLSRYYMSVIPFSIIFISAGIMSLTAWLSNKRFSKAASIILRRMPVILAFCVLFLLISLRPVYHRLLPLLPIFEVEYKEAGLWARSSLPREAVLYTPVRVIDYYAQLRHKLVRKVGRWIDETLEPKDILGLAKNERAPCFLVVQERWPTKTLQPFLDENRHYPGLVAVYINSKYKGAKVVIYSILK